MLPWQNTYRIVSQNIILLDLIRGQYRGNIKEIERNGEIHGDEKGTRSGLYCAA